jgi:uncharacterized membrane protein YccC
MTGGAAGCWLQIGTASVLTLGLRLLPLVSRNFLSDAASPTLDRFNKTFLACCISSLIIALLLPSGQPLVITKLALMVLFLALYLVIRKIYDGVLLAPALAIGYTATRFLLS